MKAGIRPQASGRGRAAFTLLELLLALAVFAVVLVAINGVYFATLRLRNKAAEAAQRALPLEQTIALIRRDLSGLMLPGGVLSGTFQTLTTSSGSLMDAAGRRVTPDLYTTTGSIDEWSPYGEVQKVAYFLANPTPPAPGFDLVRVTSRNLLPVTTEDLETAVLLENVEHAVALFYNGYEWSEVWDTTQSTNLPLGVKVRIFLRPEEERGRPVAEPIEVVSAILVQSTTNTTSSAGGGGS